MAFAFPKANRDFNIQKKTLSDASEYIGRLKGNTIMCKEPCINDYNNYNYKLGKKCTYAIENIQNNSQLNSNLYTKQNMEYACSLSNSFPCSNPYDCNINCNDAYLVPDASTPFYFSYTIDPKGQLFGNNECGTLNYMNFNESGNSINPDL